MNLAAQYRLRRRCAAALRGLDIPRPWNLEEFLERFSRGRGRRVVLLEAPSLAAQAVSGQWWKMADADLIFHAPTDSLFERDLIVFHEVAHILCHHDDDAHGTLADRDVEALVRSLALDGCEGAVATILSRDAHFGSVAEQEAEYTAYRIKLLAERAGHHVSTDDPATPQLLSTMRRTLGAGD